MNQPKNRIVLSALLIEEFFNDGGAIDHRYTNDHRIWGTKLDDILFSSTSYWENVHNFIQIVFPNPQPSKMHPDAPIINDFSVFENVYRAPIVHAYDTFLKFLGVYDNGKQIYTHRAKEWLKPTNHNILRVTRVLIFLKGVGMIPEMKTLRNTLIKCVTDFEKSRVLQYGSMDYTIRMWNNV